MNCRFGRNGEQEVTFERVLLFNNGKRQIVVVEVVRGTKRSLT